jgi:hypothetical protein
LCLYTLKNGLRRFRPPEGEKKPFSDPKTALALAPRGFEGPNVKMGKTILNGFRSVLIGFDRFLTVFDVFFRLSALTLLMNVHPAI